MRKITNVFYYSIGLVLALVLFGIFAPGTFEDITSYLQDFISTTFGWYYLILVILIVGFCVFLIFSPIGAIKLGKPEDKPEYSKPTWFAMLFSAGMGIGLVFWGAAEPLSHYIDPALAEPGTREAYKESMRYTFFHYGIHAWAIYGIIALALAYFNFRKGEPGLISATLKPVFGDRMNGKWGTFIDVFAVFATVFGVATTLGFGAAQINGGLKYLFGIPVNFTVQLVIVLIVTVLFLISAWTGLGKGIKYLSNANMYLAIALFSLVFIAGPTVLSLDIFTDTIGSYIQNFIQMSFRIAPLNEEHREWVNSWTIFYWAWWISWSPFVGLFIARVSKGRTIREFLVGVLLLPSVVSFLWFSVFGTTAIEADQTAGGIIGNLPTEQVLFAVFEQLPWTWLLSIVALILIGTFFITSADSATFVLGMLTTNGSLTPPNRIKVIWGVLQSAVALVLLYSGGLQALQNALIAAALPFSIVMILMIVSLYKSLSIEQKELGLYHEMKDPEQDADN